MSPRRRLEPGEPQLFAEHPVRAPRRWWPPVFYLLVALVMAGGIAVCAAVLVSHETRNRQAQQDRAMLEDVRAFLTIFASPDPFHANDYVQRVLDRSTGEFAKQYREKANEALLRVARSEPTTGTVLKAGVERWNDDGTANVLAITNISTKTPDGKDVIEQKIRWLVTAKPEGASWKISSLVQVI